MALAAQHVRRWCDKCAAYTDSLASGWGTEICAVCGDDEYDDDDWDDEEWPEIP
jgi:hypothetical protein